MRAPELALAPDGRSYSKEVVHLSAGDVVARR
jgi:hypothetical protein